MRTRLNGEEHTTNGGLASIPPTLVRITPPNFATAIVTVRGTAPYLQHAFSQKARAKMEETQRAGSRSNSRKVRVPRDFEEDYEQAQHRSGEGWHGIPANAFREAMISACKLVGFKMTHAKLTIFIIADGLDAVEGTPLVRIEGEPEVHRSYGRNARGTADLRWRPIWHQWSATVRIEWDLDVFSETDIMNLMMRAGRQIGIGEGRPDSPNSNGLGLGTFEVV